MQQFYSFLDIVPYNMGELVWWYQKVHFAIFWIFWCKMKITQTDTPTIWMGCHPIQTNWWTGAPISAIPPFLHWMPFLAQPSQFILACISGILVIRLVAWWHSSQQLYKIFKAQALLHCNHYLHTHAHAHDTHTHTHTHTQPFYRSIDFVQDNPGEPLHNHNLSPSFLWSTSWLGLHSQSMNAVEHVIGDMSPQWLYCCVQCCRCRQL